MQNEQKIFAVYIGGSMQNSNIELHDMRFAVAETLQGTYAQLRKEWWGVPETLHVDCWAVLEQVDNYKITLKPFPPETKKLKLYFVNLGGYDRNEFTEVHKNVFIVAKSQKEAKQKAIENTSNWTLVHKDNLFEVEKCLCINTIVQQQSLYIHLEEVPDLKPFAFSCKYIPISL